MLSRLEVEHKTKLEQIHVMQEQQKSLDITNPMNVSEESKANNTGNQIDKVFTNLGNEILTGGSDCKENGLLSHQRKGSLTLEEKQKLAKEHEQAQKLKNQQPLKPQPHTTTPPVKQTKDLTETLRDNMASLTIQSNSKPKVPASSSFTSIPPIGIGMGFSSPVESTKRNGLNANVGFQPSGFSMGVATTSQNFFSTPGITGMANMNMLPAPNLAAYNPLSTTAAVPQPAQQGRPPDMSALDSLFGPQKPKVSMNQLSQQKTNQWLNQFVPPQGTNSSVLGTQMNVVGQPGFGLQGNPFFNPQNFTQPTNVTSSSSASNDLKDLFG